MPNDIIQAQYDELASVASRFGGQAEASQQLIAQVRQAMQPLQGGGWQGRGSAAFFGEMNRDLLCFDTDYRLYFMLDALREAMRDATGVSWRRAMANLTAGGELVTITFDYDNVAIAQQESV